MKHILSIIIIIWGLILNAPSYGQGWQWGRGSTNPIWTTLSTVVDAWGVATDPSGNVFVGGYNPYGVVVSFGSYTVPNSFDSGTLPQTLLAKYDAMGNFQWAFGTQYANTELINIAADRDGNSFLLGMFDAPTLQIGSFTLTNTLPSTLIYRSQYFLVKFDPSGGVIWARNGGNATTGNGLGNMPKLGFITAGGLATDAAGNAYLTVSFNIDTFSIGPYHIANRGVSRVTFDFLVIKYDASGNLAWAKSYGGTGSESAYGITIVPSGDIYIAGVFDSPSLTFGSSVITNTSGGEQAFIARLDAMGSPVWASGSGGGVNEYASGLASDVGGNVYLLGGLRDAGISYSGKTIDNPYSSYAIYLAKFDPDNQLSWSKTIGTPTDGYVAGYSVAASPCGHVWLCGAMKNNEFNTDHGVNTDTVVTIDGNTYHAPPRTSSYDPPVIIVGFTSSGSFIGYNGLSSGGDDQSSIACDSKGNVFLGADYLIYEPYVHPIIIGTDTLADSAAAGRFDEFMYIAKYAANDTALIDTTFMHMDTTACAVERISVQAPLGCASYVWSDGHTGPNRSFSGFGTFWVVGTEPGIGSCKAAILIDSIKIQPGDSALSFSLGKDTITCDTVMLKIRDTGVDYLWQDGSTGNSYIVTHPGIYYATVSKQSCSYTDTIKISAPDLTQNLKDTAVCGATPVQLTLEANVPVGATALWSTGSTRPETTVTDSGIYWVTVTDGLCGNSDTMTLSREICDCFYYIPNAFTPNGDGKDDQFRPFIEPGCSITNYEFSIYNRWGERVYHSTNSAEGWNGMYKSIPAELGAYEYMLVFTGGSKKIKHFEKGDLTLIR